MAKKATYTPKDSPNLHIEVDITAGLDELSDRISYQETHVLKRDPTSSYEQGRLDGLIEARVLMTTTPIKEEAPKAKFKPREPMTQEDKDYNQRHLPATHRAWIDEINGTEPEQFLTAREMDFIESVALQLHRGKALSEKQIDWLEIIRNKAVD